MKGKLVIFSAPSGSGKTTIVKHLIQKGFPLEFSISACNRNPRGEEKHGVDYYFLSSDDFKKRIKNNEFIEWEEVYEGRYYGTLNSEIDRIWKNGNHVIFDVDVKGGVNIKNKFGNNAISIFIQPPSISELRNRLTGRGTDNANDIETRLNKAEEEMTYAKHFDYVVINDNLDNAKAETEKLLNTFLSE